MIDATENDRRAERPNVAVQCVCLHKEREPVVEVFDRNRVAVVAAVVLAFLSAMSPPCRASVSQHHECPEAEPPAPTGA